MKHGRYLDDAYLGQRLNQVPAPSSPIAGDKSELSNGKTIQEYRREARGF
jgi:hypothetical protein